MAQDSPDDRLWVLIETGSNQDFIFQSNRQHFHVGASEILHRVGAWVTEAVRELQASPDAEADAPEDGPTALPAIDPIVSTSSKAMLLVRDAEVGQAIVEKVTRRALKEAPGLELWGYVETPHPDHADPMTRVADVHAAHAAVRWERASAKLRFLTYPFSDLCARTGLPAAERRQWPAESGNEESLSPVAVAVRKASEGPTRQFLAGLVEKEAALGDRREEVVNAGWVAVVHIDGNAVGEVIRGIKDIEVYRRFSTRLQKATREAFASACAIPQTEGRAEWLLPLIVGGDDVTFVCDARVAIHVVRAYLTAFEQKTLGLPGLADGDCLTAAAGIAVVKPHYPFHAAYQLAEQLAHNAKQAKKPDWVKAVGRRSAYDFHVLHDSVASPLSELRRGFEVTRLGTSANAPTPLWPPLFLAPPGLPRTSAHPCEDEHLLKGAEAILAPRDEAPLSGSALHDLRAALLRGEGSDGRTLTRLRSNTRHPALLREFLEAHLRVDDGPGGTFSRVLPIIDFADITRGVAAGERARRDAKRTKGASR